MDLFKQLKESVYNIDPVAFCEKNLNLDGAPFKINGNGYKPFADIYRYVGIKALEKNSKPIVMVKGRQVGATTMAVALQLYFMTSGTFGNNGRAPMRVIHAFPTLVHVFNHAKTKLNPIIKSANLVDDPSKPGKKISCIEAKLDKKNSGDSLQYKQFIGDNYIRIESTGLDADRLRGGTVDALLYDECFPYSQNIQTSDGKIPIGRLHTLFSNNKVVPKVLTFNEKTESFEYKNILNSWNRGKRSIYELTCENRKIRCTGNHRFLTINGWKRVDEMNVGDLIKSKSPEIGQISYSLNNDQYQIMLGSFLGDGHISKSGKNNKYRLVEVHGINQKEYCNWKSSMFGCQTYIVKNNGFSGNDAIKFSTKLFAIDKTFPKNKNNCPQWILDDLDERGLAIWFMDDGSTNKKMAAVLNTCSFDEDSHIRMVKKLKSMGIDCEYRFCKFTGKRAPGYWSIFFNKKGYDDLCKLIAPYIHDEIYYKIKTENSNKYIWNNKFKNYGLISVKSIKELDKKEVVYDIEVEDNHNFIASSCRKSKKNGGLIAHNCQDIPAVAIANANKLLTTSRYGKVGKGIQLYFGTPKQRGSEYYKMWESSNQQYYYLGCEGCEKHFPLYTPGSDEWENIWVHGFIVKCTHCGHMQDKRAAAERGKWVESRPLEECQMIGFHINQLYNPRFQKEDIIAEKPENSPVNTERDWQNEVLGEFYAGEMGPITPEQIREFCADFERKMRPSISITENKRVFAGFDWGKRSDADAVGSAAAKLAGGQSYSTCVILTEDGTRLSIDYATIIKKNDPAYKKSFIDEVMRKYSVTQAVGDIGYAADLTHTIQSEYGDRFLASELVGKVNGNVRYDDKEFPKIIRASREYYIEELFNVMKQGRIRFPFGNYEMITWLIEHCTSMGIKTTLNSVYEPVRRYVKGSKPNDGFMALLNAYLAYKFHATDAFKNKKGGLMEIQDKKQILAITGYCPRM